MRKTATQHRGSLPSFIAHDDRAAAHAPCVLILRSALPCRLLETPLYVHPGHTDRLRCERSPAGNTTRARTEPSSIRRRSIGAHHLLRDKVQRLARCVAAVRIPVVLALLDAARPHAATVIVVRVTPRSLHTLSLLSSPLITRGASQYSTPLHPGPPVTRIIMIHRCVDKVTTVCCRASSSCS
jgi:hypothetical protein